MNIVHRGTARHVASAFVLLLATAAGGCGFFATPDAANIELRKENQKLHTQLDALQNQVKSDETVISGLRQSRPSIPTLPASELSKLYTVHGLKLGRLTGGVQLDPNQPGDQALKIYVVPTDEEGQPLKAAGSFVVEAFDLASKGDTHVGRWTFNLDQSRQAWNGWFMQYTYVLTCSFQKLPEHPDLIVKVSFLDELTQTRIDAPPVQVHINLPPPGARDTSRPTATTNPPHS